VAVEISARGSEGDSTIDTASATDDDVEEIDEDQEDTPEDAEEIDEDQEDDDLRAAIQVVLSLAREGMIDERRAFSDDDQESARNQHKAFELVYNYLENEELV